jgi:hypothetical protein
VRRLGKITEGWYSPVISIKSWSNSDGNSSPKSRTLRIEPRERETSQMWTSTPSAKRMLSWEVPKRKLID